MEVEQDHMVMSGRYGGQEGDSCHCRIVVSVTNFIRSYLHQFFDDSHGLKASLKPLRRPFD